MRNDINTSLTYLLHILFSNLLIGFMGYTLNPINSVVNLKLNCRKCVENVYV
jgi:hypothetical protein